MMAIADLLKRLVSYRQKLIEAESVICVVTDSLTSIQIINGYMKDKSEFDMNMENYQLADQIVKSILKLNSMGKNVEFEHKKGHGMSLGNNFADYVATNQAENLQKTLEVKNAS